METVTSKKEQLSELKGLLQKLKVKGVFQNNMIIATKKEVINFISYKTIYLV